MPLSVSSKDTDLLVLTEITPLLKDDEVDGDLTDDVKLDIIVEF